MAAVQYAMPGLLVKISLAWFAKPGKRDNSQISPDKCPYLAYPRSESS
jgi:hypothetical protein